MTTSKLFLRNGGIHASPITCGLVERSMSSFTPHFDSPPNCWRTFFPAHSSRRCRSTRGGNDQPFERPCRALPHHRTPHVARPLMLRNPAETALCLPACLPITPPPFVSSEIGRASCRERV